MNIRPTFSSTVHIFERLFLFSYLSCRDMALWKNKKMLKQQEENVIKKRERTVSSFLSPSILL